MPIISTHFHQKLPKSNFDSKSHFSLHSVFLDFQFYRHIASRSNKTFHFRVARINNDNIFWIVGWWREIWVAASSKLRSSKLSWPGDDGNDVARPSEPWGDSREAHCPTPAPPSPWYCQQTPPQPPPTPPLPSPHPPHPRCHPRCWRGRPWLWPRTPAPWSPPPPSSTSWRRNSSRSSLDPAGLWREFCLFILLQWPWNLFFVGKGLSKKRSSNPRLKMNKASPEKSPRIPDEPLSMNVKWTLNRIC